MAHAEAVRHHHVNPMTAALIAVIAILLMIVVALGATLFLRPGTSTPSAAPTTPAVVPVVAVASESAPGSSARDCAEDKGWDNDGVTWHVASVPVPDDVRITNARWSVQNEKLCLAFDVVNESDRPLTLTTFDVMLNGNGRYWLPRQEISVPLIPDERASVEKTLDAEGDISQIRITPGSFQS